ncbi:uncharacterized protein L3040_005966 [Drepanopeziza brunnea f. sp. 'multigermtubi']|uniref:Uncharacterized protein n=1 Tax=Marssonina brunnea f. sp. multigermtubi (strain MB_m1) TaxID=1072389 RepID=K1WRN7_MARBU|nr:uncharacterized protein MBM_06314 [Drepanopeziza brunnea f. sp. 'multigermtubi' MB_m1]EKD15686.1 hypothetical protein MBM_06314 [Drepanopeziza brunnea f. sp. 'multigermtubi' MB_m1]KAJ5040309.1 hypothetical protein L3040_005966 [Drepanopeziza brunnea f. sp. 'multigermtubi']
MKVSPLLTEFFAQSTIDKDNMTLPRRESCGWLLSPPVTATFSKKQVGNQHRSLQFGVDDTMESIKAKRRRRATAWQVSSDDSPYRDSMFSDGLKDDGDGDDGDNGDDDDDWVMEDIFKPTTSGTGNSHSSYGSATSQVEEEVWDANIESPSPEPFYKANARSIRARSQGHVRSHGFHRRLPSQTQRSLVESESFSQLQRTPAIRSARRHSPAYIEPFPPPLAIPKVKRPAPPPFAPSKSQSSNDVPTKWHSWPPQAAPPVPRTQVRARANPSSSTRAAPGYKPPHVPAVHSAPPSSSRFPPSPEHDLMTFSETSAFSDDDDDDDDNDHDAADDDACPFVLAMKKLQLSHGKSGTHGAAGEREKLPAEITGKKKTTPRRSFRRTLTSLESFIKKRKGGTL